MSGLSVQPMQWEGVPRLSDAPPLDQTDMACLEALRAVLARHGKTDRFAIHLAHRHFDLAPDEILIEMPDPTARTQHVMVGRREDYPAATPTTWLFDPTTPLSAAAVYCICVSDPVAQAGCVMHGKSSSVPIADREDAIRDKRIAKEKAKDRAGRPVAGHGEPEPKNDPGREH